MELRFNAGNSITKFKPPRMWSLTAMGQRQQVALEASVASTNGGLQKVLRVSATLAPRGCAYVESRHEIGRFNITRLHVDRIAGGHRDHRDSCRNAIAGSQPGKKQGTKDDLCEQP